MNKYLKTSLIILGVVLVLALAFFLPGKTYLKEITLEEYNDAIEKEALIYYGNNKKNKTELEQIAVDSGIEIKVLNPDTLSKQEIKKLNLKKDTLYVYNKGKVSYDYNDSFTSYKLKQMLMEQDLIERTYLEINIDDYLEIIKEKGYHFMFIGSDTCSYCSMFKESINESLKTYDYNVYYLNIQNLTDEDYQKLYATDSYLTEEQWGTPLNFIYKDGKRIDIINGYVETSSLVSTLKKDKVI